MSNQIEPYERPFNIVFGDDGAEPQIISGPGGKDFPIWRARQFIIAILEAQIKKSPDKNERAEFEKIKRAFRFADTGEIVFGMIRKFKNRAGKRRFIGITPKGVDYREAGKIPASEPTRRVPDFDSPARRLGVSTHRQAAPSAPVQTEAERIADKMAKASRKAVEGE